MGWGGISLALSGKKMLVVFECSAIGLLSGVCSAHARFVIGGNFVMSIYKALFYAMTMNKFGCLRASTSLHNHNPYSLQCINVVHPNKTNNIGDLSFASVLHRNAIYLI